MMDEQSQIVLYNPNDTIQLEVHLDRETVWLTQQQIADLFGVKQPAVSKHLKNIFASGELDEQAVYSILEYTAADGKKYQTRFYNLDAILSIGYRVNSINATQFRIWANRVLKDYLLKGYAINQRFMNIEQKLNEHEKALHKHEEQIEFFVRTALPPVEGIFFDGQIYDAFHFVAELIRSAKQSIILIDNYVDDSVLQMMSDKAEAVSVKIYTKTISPALLLAEERFNAQYGKLTISAFHFSHDRFLIIDNRDIYLIGASLKDLGKKWFGFAKLDSNTLPDLLKRLPQ